MFKDFLSLRIIHFDHIGCQQSLLFDPLFSHLRFKSFINKALMRGMLIDNDQPVFGLRDNIIFM